MEVTLSNQAQKKKQSVSHAQMAIAFVAGMFVTAILGQIPVAQGESSPGIDHKSIVPALPDAKESTLSGDSNAGKRYVIELV
jgi:hypothetical protein